MATVRSVVIPTRHNLFSDECGGLEVGTCRQWTMQDRFEGEGSGAYLEQTRGAGETLTLSLWARQVECFGGNRFQMQSLDLPKNTLDR